MESASNAAHFLISVRWANPPWAAWRIVSLRIAKLRGSSAPASAGVAGHSLLSCSDPSRAHPEERSGHQCDQSRAPSGDDRPRVGPTCAHTGRSRLRVRRPFLPSCAVHLDRAKGLDGCPTKGAGPAAGWRREGGGAIGSDERRGRSSAGHGRGCGWLLRRLRPMARSAALVSADWLEVGSSAVSSTPPMDASGPTPGVLLVKRKRCEGGGCPAAMRMRRTSSIEHVHDVLCVASGVHCR